MFPNCVGSIDTFPVKVYAGNGLFAGKYKQSVVKFQLVVTNQGMVSYLSGPHRGRESDTTIYRQFPPPLLGNSYLLGDKAYISCPKVLPPVKNNNRRFTGVQRVKFNSRMGHWRSRVEQGISPRCFFQLGKTPDPVVEKMAGSGRKVAGHQL